MEQLCPPSCSARSSSILRTITCALLLALFVTTPTIVAKLENCVSLGVPCSIPPTAILAGAELDISATKLKAQPLMYYDLQLHSLQVDRMRIPDQENNNAGPGSTAQAAQLPSIPRSPPIALGTATEISGPRSVGSRRAELSSKCNRFLRGYTTSEKSMITADAQRNLVESTSSPVKAAGSRIRQLAGVDGHGDNGGFGKRFGSTYRLIPTGPDPLHN